MQCKICSGESRPEREKRIIYVIPYNSIIDQTADVLESLFGKEAQILRHQSTFSYDGDDYDEDYRQAAKCASENWDAPLIITTAVQFLNPFTPTKRKTAQTAPYGRQHSRL